MSARQTAVVVCPGRGSYGPSELGSLTRLHGREAALLGAFDRIRAAAGQEVLSALDRAAAFAPDRHLPGDNASALVFAGALLDFRAIDPARIEIVAVTGNSMGWYSALACAGALSPEAGFTVANTMGGLMHARQSGGQIVYPVLGEDWRPDQGTKAALLTRVAEIGARPGQTLSLSIDLGGAIVVAGDEAGLAAFASAVPARDAYPLRLPHHGAFHSALVAPVAEAGRLRLGPELFGQPRLPAIDGRGAIWWPRATDTHALWDYTLGHQVTEPYDLARAISVAAREFAPDLFIVTGPGVTMSAAVAQALISAGWRGIADKAAFQARQKAGSQSGPVIAAMGRSDQRAGVVAPA